jgi:hypothetical protein
MGTSDLDIGGPRGNFRGKCEKVENNFRGQGGCSREGQVHEPPLGFGHFSIQDKRFPIATPMGTRSRRIVNNWLQAAAKRVGWALPTTPSNRRAAGVAPPTIGKFVLCDAHATTPSSHSRPAQGATYTAKAAHAHERTVIISFKVIRATAPELAVQMVGGAHPTRPRMASLWGLRMRSNRRAASLTILGECPNSRGGSRTATATHAMPCGGGARRRIPLGSVSRKRMPWGSVCL